MLRDPILARDLTSAIGGSGIDHDDLVRPAHALEYAPEVRFFIQRDDCDGECVRHCRKIGVSRYSRIRLRASSRASAEDVI